LVVKEGTHLIQFTPLHYIRLLSLMLVIVKIADVCKWMSHNN